MGEKQNVLGKCHKIVRQTTKKVVSWLLIMAMLVTLPQALPGMVTEVKAADQQVKVYYKLPAGTTASQYGVNTWGSNVVVTGNTETTISPDGWNDGNFPSLLTDDTKPGWGYVTIAGTVNGLQFVTAATKAGVDVWNPQITAQGLTEVYYIPDNAKWYTEAEGTNEVAAPVLTNVSLHFQNGANWTTPTIQFWDTSKITATGGKTVPIPGWNTNGEQLTLGEDGFYNIKLQGIISGFQFLDLTDTSKLAANAYVADMAKYTEETPKDLYYLYDATAKNWTWYLDAEGTTKLVEEAPEPEVPADKIETKVSDLVQVKIGEISTTMQLYNNGVYETALDLKAGTSSVQLMVNGTAAGDVDEVTIAADGKVYFRLQDGVLIDSVNNSDKWHTAAFTGDFANLKVDGEAFNVVNWTPGDPNGELTYLGGGIYSGTFSFDATTAAFDMAYKVAFDDKWDYALGDGGDDILVTVPVGTTSITVWVDEIGGKVYDNIRTAAFEKMKAFTSNVSLIGSARGMSEDDNWNSKVEGFEFTQISENLYLYQKVFAAKATPYEYKAVFDYTVWIDDGANRSFTIDTDGTNVVFMYDAAENKIYDSVNQASVIGQTLGMETVPVEAKVTANSNGTLKFITLAEADAKVQLVYGNKADMSEMTTVNLVNQGDGSFASDEIFLGDAAAEIVYYYLVNGVETLDASNKTETIAEKEYLVYSKAAFTGRTVNVPGTFPGKSWDAKSNQMEYKGEGLYMYTFKDVPAANYEYKIAMGTWDENYGANGVKTGENIAVTVLETQDVTVYYSDLSHYARTSIDYVYGATLGLEGDGIPEGTTFGDPRLTGIYSATVALEAGTYSNTVIRISSTETLPCDPYTVATAKKVTFYYDPVTEIYYNNASDVNVQTANIRYNTKDSAYKSVYGAVATDEEVTFTIETGEDATSVRLIVKEDKSLNKVMVKDGEAVGGVQKWSITTSFPRLGEYNYFFVIGNGSAIALYGDDAAADYGLGTTAELSTVVPYDLVVYQSGYETPDWMKDAVIYQIFPERFYDGDTSNNTAQTNARGTTDYEYVTDWYTIPENPEQETLHPDQYPANAYVGDGNWSNEIYGGDLEGIIERMDYLKALGVNVIYLNPVFASISSHRYDTSDYNEIDPILGTEGDFTELVAAADANGMHIVLDGVFNHVSDDSKYFDRYYEYLDKLKDSTAKDKAIGAYPYWAYVYDYMADNKAATQEDAEEAAKTYFTAEYGITDYSYAAWFDVFQGSTLKDDAGAEVKDTVGLRAGKAVYGYDGWWGYDSMPVIKSTNGSEYQTGGSDDQDRSWAEEIIGMNETSKESDGSVTQYWLSKGMDGWRLDVANEVSDETWQHFRKSVKALDDDNVIIGEIWTDAAKYIMGDMYDSVMNYVFRGAVLAYANGGTAQNYVTTLEKMRERYPKEAFYAMMNLVSSHDTTRILSYLDGINDDRAQTDSASAFPTYDTTSDFAKAKQYLVAFLQFTYAGAPTIYYGDEIGMVGADDPDDRRAMTWGEGNEQLVEWYASLAKLRSNYSALRTGSVEVFDTKEAAIVSFVRRDDSNNMIVLANNSQQAVNVTIDLTALEVTGTTLTDLISGTVLTPAEGKVTVTVPALSGAVLTDTAKAIATVINKSALAPAYDASYAVADAKVVVDAAATVAVGKTTTIKATSRATLTWTSSDKSIATVDANGKVTAVKAGKVTITATQTDGQSAVCTVTVTNPITALTIDKTTAEVEKGEKLTLKATVTPADAQDAEIAWTSSNTKVATVDANGKVTAVAAGTATITAATANGMKATCTVTVIIPATKVIISSKERIAVGKSKKLAATMTPSNTTDEVTWKSSNKKVATVDKNGKVKAIKAGTATITATTTSGKKDTCKVTVVKKAVAATSVKLNKTKLSLNVAKTADLNATMSPSKSTDSLTWSSSNKKVATVDKNGVVTAVKKGTAKITVKTTSGKKATCTVTVKVPSTKIVLSKTKATVKKGKTVSLKASAAPSNTTDKVTWSSSNKKVATVGKNGKVKGIKKGTVTITVKTSSGKKDTCKVTVK